MENRHCEGHTGCGWWCWWWLCLYLEVAFIVYIQFVQNIVTWPQLNYLFAGDGEEGLGYTVYLHICPGEKHKFGKHKILLLLQTRSSSCSFCIKLQPERTSCTVINECPNTVRPSWLSLLRFYPRMGRSGRQLSSWMLSPLSGLFLPGYATLTLTPHA